MNNYDIQVKKLNDNSIKEHSKQGYINIRNNFIKFNIGVILLTTILGLISYEIPKRKTHFPMSPFIKNNILPMIYFIFFSILLGGVFLIGDEEMRGFLSYFVKDKLLDLGIIAAYFGIVSIIIATFLRRMIEHGLGFSIKSAAIYDIIGFIIGRIILLSIIYVIEKPNLKKPLLY